MFQNLLKTPRQSGRRPHQPNLLRTPNHSQTPKSNKSDGQDHQSQVGPVTGGDGCIGVCQFSDCEDV